MKRSVVVEEAYERHRGALEVKLAEMGDSEMPARQRRQVSAQWSVAASIVYFPSFSARELEFCCCWSPAPKDQGCESPGRKLLVCPRVSPFPR